ncbi:family 20 glycosylhydrolase [Ferruginibacter paludis]|uniref:beta-N-acetylhexosaminidase n=1 Tax=Ferruginibacter paludis TaxID=1310417 RepID=UPI0025B57439|nr:family 20 glycosylhydrolase [Ferruginibacter paludis]MDN3654825.1 family 20 glycosylhydrolase [Ferruginibacter paludis]
MKRIVFFLACCLPGLHTFCQQAAPVSIIPEPVQMVQNAGVFMLPSTITIEAPILPAVKPILDMLQQRLSAATGYKVLFGNEMPSAILKLSLNKTADATIGSEGYRLNVSTTNITISANQPAGLFYGVQTLMQLLPAEIESKSVVQNVKWQAPCVTITDYPKVGWRGLMFDVSRHFFTKKEVKDFIDQMSKYKYNLFHWHLTDDEGWRIEIKSYPNLTKKGAWSVAKTGYFGTFSQPLPDEPKTNGGFYTQDDIKEVIQYAKDRFINILPEVDVPGHSMAAVASYPELSCTPGADKYDVIAGESFMDWSHGAPPIALKDNTLCPANEKVYVFLDKVMTEIAGLFPFEYIHVGGDECPKNFWEQSDAIKALMQKEGLKTMEQVQSYFEKRLEKIVESKGKKFMGWDEILEGGLAPNAAVMSWRGEKGGIEAAKLKHDVVMSPTTYAYLDYMQGDEIIEPRIYATLRLKKSYEFEPLLAGVDPKYIKGGQANLWSEQLYNVRHMQYMLWPRAFAIAECVWSPKEKKDWNHFVTKVEDQFKRYDIEQVKYAPSMYDPIFTAQNTNGQLQIELTTEIEGLDIYYSFDNSFPDQYYPKYTAPLTPPKDAVMMKVITYRGYKPIGRMIAMPLAEMQKRAGLKK